jgi:hypothetical protein
VKKGGLNPQDVMAVWRFVFPGIDPKWNKGNLNERKGFDKILAFN